MAALRARPRRSDLFCFGGTRVRRGVCVHTPASEAELVRLVLELGARKESFAPLGTGLSFDGQGFPEGVAVSTLGFRKIEIDVQNNLLRVGAGVKAGQAAAAALTQGRMLAVLPSCSEISLGGSASADTYSRMTPGYGRESASIRALRLCTPDGKVHACSREQNQDLFYAALGGFGLVGVITELEYRLLPIGTYPAFATSAHAFEGVSGFQHLIPDHRPPGLGQGAWPGAGAVVIDAGGSLHTMISRHRYESTTRRKRTLAHQRGPTRWAAEFMVRRVPSLASRLWKTNWRPRRPKRFIDEVAGATFFMDASYDLERLLARLGRPSSVMQQSFVFTTDARSTGSAEKTESFVLEANRAFRSARLHPGMFDVGFLPPNEPFVLSANAAEDAFLVSAAFPVSDPALAPVIARVFEDLSQRCLTTYGGQVHLTKQVFCSDEDLRTAYAGPIARLKRLRDEHDPNRLLVTALGRRLGLYDPQPKLQSAKRRLAREAGIRAS